MSLCRGNEGARRSKEKGVEGRRRSVELGLTARASSESSISSRKVMGFEGAVGRGPDVPMSMMVAFCKLERREREGQRGRRRSRSAMESGRPASSRTRQAWNEQA